MAEDGSLVVAQLFGQTTSDGTLAQPPAPVASRLHPAAGVTEPRRARESNLWDRKCAGRFLRLNIRQTDVQI